MAQILVPDSDVATGSWSSTPLWSKINDDSTVNASGDGTVITSDNNTSPDNADFTIADGTDPSSSSNHVLRARWNKDSTGGHAINAVLELYQGAAGTGTLIATLSVTGIGATEVESTYTLSTAEADNITNYADLSLRVSRQGDTGGSPNGRRSLVVDLVEFEVPDADATSVTVELTAASASIAAQTLNLSLNAATTELVASTGTFAAQALGVSLGAAVVELAPAAATLTPQALDLSLGATTVELSTATASLTAQVLGVDIAGSSVSVELVPATGSLAAQALGVSVDPLAVELSPAMATLAVQALGVSVTALTVELTPATMNIVAQALGVDASQPITVELSPALMTITAQILEYDGVGESEAERLDRVIRSMVIGYPAGVRPVIPLRGNIKRPGVPVRKKKKRQSLTDLL